MALPGLYSQAQETEVIHPQTAYKIMNGVKSISSQNKNYGTHNEITRQKV